MKLSHLETRINYSIGWCWFGICSIRWKRNSTSNLFTFT